MKKLCVLFCLFFCAPVFALEYSPLPCENINDFVKVERRYKWYVERDMSFYFREGENTDAYDRVDFMQSKKTAFSSWSYEKPKPYKHRVVEERDAYVYQEINPIEYLYLFSLMGSEGRLFINEIELYDNDQKIPFQIKCEECSKDFASKVTDQNYEEGGYVKESSIIEIKIEPKKYQNLNLRLLLHDEGMEMKRIEVRATHERNIEDVYYDYASQHFFTHSNLKEIEEVMIPVNRMRKRSPKFGEDKISLEPIKETEERKVQKKKQYRYQDTLFKYSQTVREYLDGYKVESVGIKDPLLYKDYFLCKSTEIFKKEKEPLVGRILSTQTSMPIKSKIKKRQTSCPTFDETIQKKLQQCQREKKKTFFWIFLFLLLLILYELYQRHSHKN